MVEDSTTLAKGVFQEGIERLEAAFRQQPLPEKSLHVYYEFLKKYSNHQFVGAVEYCILNENFFPSIKTLMDAVKSSTPIKYHRAEDATWMQN